MINGIEVCRGRGWGCLGRKTNAKGRLVPRFVAMICEGGDAVVSSSGKRGRRPKAASLPADARVSAVILGPEV